MAKGKRSSGGRNLEQQQSFYQSQIDNAESLKLTNDELKEYEAGLKRVNGLIQKQNLSQEASLTNMTEMSDSIKSLGAGLGKNNKLFETMNLFGAQFQGTLTSVSKMLKHETLKGATGFTKQTYKTVEAYKNLGNTIAVNAKKLAKQQITQSQYNQAVLNGYEDIEEEIDRLTGQLEGMDAKQKANAQKVITTLKEEKDVLEATAKAAEKSKKNLEGTAFALDTISSNIPGMDKLGDVIMKAKEGGMGLTLAIAALGAAIGKMVYDLGIAGNKIATIAKYDKQLIGLNASIEKSNQQIGLGLTGDGGFGNKRNFVAEGAVLDFSNTITQMGIQFEAASKTALFGDKLGGVGYGAAQLQMAGISAETIATAMKDMTSLMGSNVSGEFGADMALLAARTGQTSEGIASIADTFMRLGDVSAETAINLQEGLRTMAKQANVNLGALMEDVAAASKDALSYQLKSPNAIAKAATFAASLGVKFKTIADAGRNMVLNYKDSIKAEMSLSAMLGRRVDLSQVRALFAAGRPEDALRALKSQGLDPSTMSIFAQESLKNALGGMDLNDIQKVTKGNGKTGGELQEENVKVGNKSFAISKTAAASAEAVGAAVAAAMTDIKRTQLEADKNMAIEQEKINNKFLQGLHTELLQTQAKKDAEVGAGQGTAALIGSAITTGAYLFLTKGKGLATIAKSLSTGAGKSVVSKVLTTSGASISNGLKFNSVGRVINAQSGKYASTATANAFKSSQSLVQPAGTFAKPGMASSLTSNLANTAKAGFGSKVVSNLASSVKGVGGVLSVLTAAYDYKQRKDAGQTTLQAGAGAVTGAGGALAGAALGSAIFPVVGTIIGGAIGYWAGSSLADELTGANEPNVAAQGEVETQVEMSSAEIEKAISEGNLLTSSEYAVELQQKMLVMMGLQTEILYDIASEQRAVTSVNLDGQKVLSLLNSRANAGYGVTRLTAINRKVQ
jgi:hypothetical protein